jgi:hypothetical protein
MTFDICLQIFWSTIVLRANRGAIAMNEKPSTDPDLKATQLARIKDVGGLLGGIPEADKFILSECFKRMVPSVFVIGYCCLIKKRRRQTWVAVLYRSPASQHCASSEPHLCGFGGTGPESRAARRCCSGSVIADLCCRPQEPLQTESH